MQVLDERNILDAARRFCESHAISRDTPVTLAVCSPSGECVFLLKMHGAPQLSYDIAVNKARTSAVMKVTTRAFHERLIHEGLSVADFAEREQQGLSAAFLFLLEMKYAEVSASAGASRKGMKNSHICFCLISLKKYENRLM